MHLLMFSGQRKHICIHHCTTKSYSFGIELGRSRWLVRGSLFSHFLLYGLFLSLLAGILCHVGMLCVYLALGLHVSYRGHVQLRTNT